MSIASKHPLLAAATPHALFSAYVSTWPCSHVHTGNEFSVYGTRNVVCSVFTHAHTSSILILVSILHGNYCTFDLVARYGPLSTSIHGISPVEIAFCFFIHRVGNPIKHVHGSIITHSLSFTIT
jgi:hypothetical protein